MSSAVDIQQLDEARTKFTELGDAISELSQTNTDALEALIKNLEGGFKTVLDNLSKDSRLSDGTKVVGASEQYVASVAHKFNAISKDFGSLFDGVEKTIAGVESSFSHLSSQASAAVAASSPAGAEEGEGGAEGAATEGGGDTQRIGGDPKKRGKKKGVIGKYVSSEVKTLKGRIGGMMSKLKIPKMGAIVSGFLGILIYGYLDRDRVRAQTGEMKNILIAAYDDGVKGALAKGTARLSSMQETFQRFLGIQREEIQNTAQAFVDGGFSVSQMLQQVNVNLGKFESNFVSATLALDKMFELPGGDSAKRMIGYMADYGKNAEEAQKSLFRLFMVGKESGIGTMQFVKNVEEAGSELAKMGYDIDNVVDIYKHVTDEFEKMGVPKQFAGKQAALGLQQMAGGVAKMGDNWKVVLGERLGYGRGLDARQKMMDAFLRVSEGRDTNEVLRIVGTIYEMAMQATGQNEETARFYVETQMGLGFEGARLIAKIGKDLREGKTVEAAQATKDNIIILKNAFHTEAQKTSKFELMMNKWLKGMANFGQGLMGLIIQALAYLIAYFKAIPQIISNIVSRDWKANEKIAADIDGIIKDTKENKELMSRGLDKMAAAATGMAKDIIGPSLQALKEAWNYDPYKGRDPTVSKVAPGEKRPGTPDDYYLKDPGMKINVPMEELRKPRKVLEADLTPERSKKALKEEGTWVGGGLHLTFQGVDGEGNITVIVTGTCPRCGYNFGSGEAPDYSLMPGIDPVGAYTSEDVEALARMIRSETGDVDSRRKKEQLGVAWTAINRQRGKKGGGNLAKTITSGLGWGRSDARRGRKGRKYASGNKPNPATIDFARSILRGDPGTEDWTKDMPGKGKGKGATGFVHSPGQQDLESPWWKDSPGEVVGEVAVPGQDKEARFWREL